MRDPARIPVVAEALVEAWERHPDWRLGQLIRNALPVRDEARVLFEREDGEWIEWLREL